MLLPHQPTRGSILSVLRRAGATLAILALISVLGQGVAQAKPVAASIVVDAETGEVRKITSRSQFTSAQDVSRDDSLIAFVVNEDPRGKGIATFDPAKNLHKFYPITPPAPYTVIGDVRISPDGKEVAFALAAQNPDKERGAVYRLNLETGKTTLVAATKPDDNTYFQVHGWTAQGTVIYK